MRKYLVILYIAEAGQYLVDAKFDSKEEADTYLKNKIDKYLASLLDMTVIMLSDNQEVRNILREIYSLIGNKRVDSDLPMYYVLEGIIAEISMN